MAFLALFLIVFLFSGIASPSFAASSSRPTWWQIQSIDTMKYSRDLAREKSKDSGFDSVIDTQVKNIAAAGTTHIALATPYDEEFIPYLKRWVNTARKYQLNVWFRGNFSGWEGWFGYPPLSAADHTAKISQFIIQNHDLFADGDVFSSCPECENGGPGDPRRTGQVDRFRRFLISEYQSSLSAFSRIHKKVILVNSTNGDVAKLVFDPDTSSQLGSLIGIDHYVKSPDSLSRDIARIAKQSKSRVVLGEFGAPIPDIHGRLTPKEQSVWLDKVLKNLIPMPDLAGLNYWTNTGSSTQLWTESGEPEPAVDVLTSYYFPSTSTGQVIDEFGSPISSAHIVTPLKSVSADADGHFQIPLMPDQSAKAEISAQGYFAREYNLYSSNDITQIVLKKASPGIIYNLKYLIFRLLGYKIYS
ncbi:hypothetical protein A3D85_02800 [Candidatus Amesbacteria bacterium RIFCSPHIGHO2_02_FULL_47_9]|nr:MAG: hypothetical protein A3D85_02800 [Candidatus Amesbacteria bacterium RIFCSPHIGHO2_02_FULL_47_9]